MGIDELREKAREANRRWYAKHGISYYHKNSEKQIENHKKYESSEVGKSTRKARRYKFYEKEKARWTVQNALRNGKLDKKNCEICGNINSQAHHADYSKPLEVKWLCDLHHKQEHGKLRIKV